jgi:hypothetical protein
MQPPVLVYADYSKPFIVQKDSRSYRLGAVLPQKKGWQGKGNSLRQQRVTTSSKEIPCAQVEISCVKVGCY